jgi:hypothetical protein
MAQFRDVVIHRSAIRGRMVSAEYAKKHPKTTVREVRKVPVKKKRKK